MANCSSVDGQAAFLGEAAEHDHIDYFQGLQKFRERGLPCILPANIQASLTQDPKILTLKRKVEQLELGETTDPCEVSRAEKEIQSYQNRLKKEALKQYKQDWVRQQRDQKIFTKGEELSEHDIKTYVFRSLRLIMPERSRLAKAMASDKPLTEEEMRQAMKDLFALCTRDLTILYRPGEEPVDGACPVKHCGKDMKE